MVDMIDDHVAAWRDGDGEAVAGYCAPAGEFVIVSGNSVQTYAAADGSLTDYVDAGSWASKYPLTPMLLDGSTVTLSYTFMGTHPAVVEFTPTGELLITRNVVHR